MSPLHRLSASRPLLLGVDAGGTRSRARLADSEGKVQGEGFGPAANVLTDPDGAWSSIQGAIRAALRASGAVSRPLSELVAVLGLAGLDPVAPAAPSHWPLSAFRACRVETDAYIAQRGAFGGGDGAVLIVGTGAVGLAVLGQMRISTGGYGAAVSDEGSGAWIGREALRRALWAFDGCLPRTPLTNRVLQTVGEPPSAQAWANAARPAEYAALAPLVLEAAQADDDLGRDILDEAGRHLRRIVDRLADAGARKVCLMGGLADALRPRLGDMPLQVVAPQGEALSGALSLARSIADAEAPAGQLR